MHSISNITPPPKLNINAPHTEIRGNLFGKKYVTTLEPYTKDKVLTNDKLWFLLSTIKINNIPLINLIEQQDRLILSYILPEDTKGNINKAQTIEAFKKTFDSVTFTEAQQNIFRLEWPASSFPDLWS